jgi:predicted ATPase/DNA-binding XRE family transcriptional regulator
MPNQPASVFGDLLRRYRRGAGLTQEGLAERAGLSVHGVQKLERGVTHPYRETAERLAAVLQLTPEDAQEFHSAVRPVRRHGSLRAGPARPSVQHNLPTPVSSFIGRDLELAEVTARLAETRLLTLIGVGGCGKTRLALEVARSAATKYPHGVWLVELGPLSDPTQVAQKIGAVLSVRESPDQPITSALISALVGRRVLMVLDNCEHLLQACAVLLDSVLRGCPELHVLATSRESIGIDGEVAWRVPSLAVPDTERAVVAELQNNPSVRLFVERARAVQPRFALTAREAPAVSQICRRLDGIPLALELAAARIQALTAEQLAVRLDQRFRLLTGGSRAALPRQQTLQATLDWSYDLLSQSERRLFERLAVFAGGWTLEAAEAIGVGVGVAEDDVFDLLARLVRKSLVVASEAADGAEHYALLETVRDYARQKLVARGAVEATSARERHAAYYSDLAERFYTGTWVRGLWVGEGAGAAELRDHVDEVHENLRTALDWWVETRHPTHGLRVALTLCEFWVRDGLYAEARRWLERMLDLASDATEVASATEGPVVGVALELRVDALINLGLLASWQGEYVRSCAHLDSAAALVHELGNPTVLARTLNVLGMSLWLSGSRERSRTVLDESLRISIESGDPIPVAVAQRNLGIVARWEAHYERANAMLRESVVQAQRTSNRAFSVARSLSNLARVAHLQADHQQALKLLHEALAVIREDRLAGLPLADSLDWLAAVALAQDDVVRAARLFGAAEAQWRASGAVRYAAEQPAFERDLASVRARLDEHTFATAWSEGRAMNAEMAVAYALDGTAQIPGRTSLDSSKLGENTSVP